MTPKGEYKITFEVFGQKRKCSIMANSTIEAKRILFEQIAKQVVILGTDYTMPASAEKALSDLEKMFGFSPDKI